MSTQYTVCETITAKVDIIPPKTQTPTRNTSWRPYIELTRCNKAAGLVGICFPYIIGFLFSINLASPTTFSATDAVKLVAIFLLDGLIFRSFGCAWNDTIDQDLDRQVERCKKRPLARGAIETPEALATTLVLAIARHALVLATLPPSAARHAVVTSVMALVYPFMKRMCSFPQLWLATAVGWAIFIVDAVVVDGSNGAASANTFDAQSHNKAILAMYASQTLFNMTYDTVYAFQDIEDDLKAGVGSLAIIVRSHPKVFLLSIASAMSAFLWASVSCGDLVRGPYMASALVSSFAALFMLVRINVWDPRECRDFFVNSQWWVSGALVVGLLGELYIANL